MGTLTINTSAGEDTRLQVAYGKRLGLAGNANAAQIKSAIIDQIKQVVLEYEQSIAAQAAVVGVSAIAPT